MPRPRQGEVWMVDLRLAARVRPCILLTEFPTDDELALVTIVTHTTTLKGTRWELDIPKPFLQPGAFSFQQIYTVPLAKLERKLGDLTPSEYEQVLDLLALRLGL